MIALKKVANDIRQDESMKMRQHMSEYLTTQKVRQL